VEPAVQGKYNGHTIIESKIPALPLNQYIIVPLANTSQNSTPLLAPVELEYVPAVQAVHAVTVPPANRQRAHTGFIDHSTSVW
jgi:hypothetical protein